MKTEEQNPQTSDQYQSPQRGKGIGAFLLILIGTIFLLNNFDLIPFSVWDSLIKFWPLLLVLWGLQIALGKSKFSQFLIAFIGLTFTFFFLIIFASSTNPDFNNWVTKLFPNFHPDNFRFLIR